jgi:chromosome segregation ATPase
MYAPQMRTIGWTSLILTTALFVLAGCDDSGLQQAKQEARKARAEVNLLQVRLQRAENECQELKKQVNSVRETRDTLNDRVNQLAKEKEKASTMAAQAQQTATSLAARADSEADTMASLKEKVAALNSLVAEQKATIQQYQVTLEQMQQYIAQQGAAMPQTPTTTTGEAATEPETNQNQPTGGGGQ